MTDQSRYGVDTMSVWAAEAGPYPHGAAVTPVYGASTFAHDNLEEWHAIATGESPGHIYSRNSNPTLAVLEQKVALLDGTEAAAAFSTGMAAISSTLLSLLKQGDRVVSIRDSYGGTNVLFEEFLPRYGIAVTLCGTTDFDAIEAQIAAGCAVVYLETPTNPTLKVVDIGRLCAAARTAGDGDRDAALLGHNLRPQAPTPSAGGARAPLAGG